MRFWPIYLISLPKNISGPDKLKQKCACCTRRAFPKKYWGWRLNRPKEELAPYLGYQREYRSDFFYLAQNCTRLTQDMVIFGRSHIEKRFRTLIMIWWILYYPYRFRSGMSHCSFGP